MNTKYEHRNAKSYLDIGGAENEIYILEISSQMARIGDSVPVEINSNTYKNLNMEDF